MMKKKNIFIYLMASSLLLSGAVMTSCESMIEEKPFDFIVPEDVEDSDNGADMWVTGVYNTLHEAMFRYGSFPFEFVIQRTFVSLSCEVTKRV